MPALGTFFLLASFVVAAYAVAASRGGRAAALTAPDRERRRRLLPRGGADDRRVRAFMVHAFVTNNYAIKYVQRYSDTAQPLGYKIASYWGGLDGSIMFWVFLLAVFGSIAVCVQPRTPSRADPLRRCHHRRPRRCSSSS